MGTVCVVASRLDSPRRPLHMRNSVNHERYRCTPIQAHENTPKLIDDVLIAAVSFALSPSIFWASSGDSLSAYEGARVCQEFSVMSPQVG